MLVKEIMVTNVRTTTPDNMVSEVALTMCFNKISGMPVVDNNNNLVGVISKKDILHAMYPKVNEFIGDGVGALAINFESLETEYQDVMNQKVKGLMTSNLFTVSENEPILRAVSIMGLKKIRRIPVANDGKLVGIVSMGDVHKEIFQKNLANLQPSEAVTPKEIQSLAAG